MLSGFMGGGGGGGGGGAADDGVARDRLREFQAQIFELEDLFQVACGGVWWCVVRMVVHRLETESVNQIQFGPVPHPNTDPHPTAHLIAHVTVSPGRGADRVLRGDNPHRAGHGRVREAGRGPWRAGDCSAEYRRESGKRSGISNVSWFCWEFGPRARARARVG